MYWVLAGPVRTKQTGRRCFLLPDRRLCLATVSWSIWSILRWKSGKRYNLELQRLQKGGHKWAWMGLCTMVTLLLFRTSEPGKVFVLLQSLKVICQPMGGKERTWQPVKRWKHHVALSVNFLSSYFSPVSLLCSSPPHISCASSTPACSRKTSCAGTYSSTYHEWFQREWSEHQRAKMNSYQLGGRWFTVLQCA